MEEKVIKLVDHYKMEQHPEGGWYKEVYRSTDIIKNKNLENRNILTSIYFLLTDKNCSKFHSIQSDELWYYHSGSGFTVHCLSPKGLYYTLKIGPNFLKGEVFQALVPKGTIFGSTVEEKDGYSLVGCAVAPGFDFSDFRLHSADELLQKFPNDHHIIKRLT
ncbi:MAG: cupin domain-containing protein [Crocinitomicaceae bacterium]